MSPGIRVDDWEADAPFRYVRFREPPYSDDDLAEFAARVRPLLDDGKEVSRTSDTRRAHRAAYAERLPKLLGSVTTMRFQLVPRPGQPDFLDLPWDHPLEEWNVERLAIVERGISRHVVRFVEYDGTYYALKELPHRHAHREYHLLRELSRHGLPGVEVVGIAHRPALEDILITPPRVLAPVPILLAPSPLADMRDRLRDALANLLVRLHLSGFFWGDCSLSNTLFRRDAHKLAAYVVDVETGELHETLSDGQRMLDLELAEQNIAGELLDLEAELGDLGLRRPLRARGGGDGVRAPLGRAHRGGGVRRQRALTPPGAPQAAERARVRRRGDRARRDRGRLPAARRARRSSRRATTAGACSG